MEIQNLIVQHDFYHHFQPIFDIQSGELFGYEGLFRTDNNLTPEVVFNVAKKRMKLYELDSRSIHKASFTYSKAGYFFKAGKLFLNVYPSTLINPSFPTLIKSIINEFNIPSQQIIFEINEEEFIDFDIVKKSIFKIKNLGVGFAIDDYGKGYSSMQSVIELNPNFVKLDKYYMINFNQQKHDVIKFLVQFCGKYNCDLIIEGVEDKESLELLISSGVNYAQGYFLGRPSSID